MQSEMLLERRLEANDLWTVGVRGYVTLHRLAQAVDAPMTIEYWKSAPYSSTSSRATRWGAAVG